MNTKSKINMLIYIALCVLLFECTSDKKNESSLIHIDVSASYPEKEIKLEDVADIEYLQIEVNEDFLFDADPEIITSDIIIIRRLYGEILVFSREGKPLSKFNHAGGGPGEYAFITGKSIYDETSEEIYVRTQNKLMVYSLSGDFRRVLFLLEEEGASITNIVNYDSEMLLLYDNNNVYPAPFTFISKKDGSVVETVNMPGSKKLDLAIKVAESKEGAFAYLQPPLTNILKYNDGYLLTDFSNDTIYFLSQEKVLSPILVRKPKIHSMDSRITLHGFVEAGNYEFMFTTKVQLENGRLPRKYLMRDKKIGSVYIPKITFNDYKGKEVNISPFTIFSSTDSKLGLIVLSLTELQDANSENKLGGKLKELVDNSDEDGNDIYMLLHFK